MSFSRVWLTALALLFVITITGCARRTPPPPPPPPAPPAPVVQPDPPPPPPPPAPAPVAPRPLTEEEVFSKMSLEELNATNPLAEVLFDYDQSAIREDQRATLQKNADWMRRWTSTRVQVEGHADARGTNEYNLALGERRANAVRGYLVGLGIGGDRVSIVSRGEESPVCTDDTEGCHQRNRRGRFIVTAK